MPTSLPRPQRQIDQDIWIPGWEDSTSTAFYSGGITAFRAEGPTNFLDPNAVDLQENLSLSPPSYAEVRHANRPEITRGGGQPVVSSNLMDLNDVRHEEIDAHTQMNGRLEAVPHYPVYLEAPARYPTRPRSRSPASIASSSTTTALMSVGQLPGSEPFDLSSPPLPNYSSSTPSPTIQPQTRSANSARAEATISGPLVTQPAFTGGHMANVSEISWFWDDLSQEYWKPPDRGYYAPEARSDFRHTIHLSNRLNSRDLVPGCRSFQRPRSPDSYQPPPPPPKDPGYEASPRNNGRNRCLDRLRQCRPVPLRRRKER